MPNGGLVSLIVFVPNLLWLFFPPQDIPPGAGESGHRFLRGLEGLSRVAVFVIPFFYDFQMDGPIALTALAVMGVSLAVYYLGWFRYFSAGRLYRFLWMPLAGMPVPLAVAPTIYFLAASVALASWPLAIASALLGISHIPLSLMESQRRD